jgi:hypothetical protein
MVCVYVSISQTETRPTAQAMLKYVKALQLGDPLVRDVHPQLVHIAGWVSTRYQTRLSERSPLDQDPTGRRRIRMAFECFALVNRIWGEDIPVKVRLPAAPMKGFPCEP